MNLGTFQGSTLTMEQITLKLQLTSAQLSAEIDVTVYTLHLPHFY